MDRSVIEAIMRRKKLSRKLPKIKGGIGAGKRTAQPCLVTRAKKRRVS